MSPLDIDLVENPQQLSGSGIVLRYEVLRSGIRSVNGAAYSVAVTWPKCGCRPAALDAGEVLAPVKVSKPVKST